MTDRLLAELVEVVGAAHVLRSPELTAGYETDWTGRWHGRARAVVRPASTAEVAAVIERCAAHQVALVPQGGNTGLVGGGVPRTADDADARQLLVSLRRLDQVDAVDPAAAQVNAGAGVTLSRLQERAAQSGLAFAVDLTARDSATIGGMVATNAGGLHVLRYGTMRAQVVGLEAVLSSGQVVSRMSGLVKDNSGYDLPGLLCGSEGTLAVITAARLRLVPRLSNRVTALLACASIDAALALLARVRELSSLEALEVMFDNGVQLVCRYAGLARPFPRPYPCLVLAECAGQTDPSDELMAVLAGAPEVLDSAVASDSAGREHLWSWRERHTEAVNAVGVPHKLDVTLPFDGLSSFVAELGPLVHAVVPEAQVIVWGHLGDGNLHVNVVGPAADDTSVDEAVLRLVAARSGSISAEHGIGVAKQPWLALTRSPSDRRAMAAIKHALDPADILNPGVILPRSAQ